MNYFGPYPYPYTSGGGAGNPASPNSSVQFNNDGVFGGTANFLWNNSLNQLYINGTINVVSGYKLNNSAAEGYYLRGNGTVFTSSLILAGDLPTHTHEEAEIEFDFAEGHDHDGINSKYIAAGTSNIITGTAGESISYGDACYLSSSNGKWYKAKADAYATMDAYAICYDLDGLLADEEGNFCVPGMINQLSGLTPGAIYYLSKATAGAWTTTPPNSGDWEVVLGLGITEEEFLFNPGYIAFKKTAVSGGLGGGGYSYFPSGWS
jgi:hypothetical protein